MNGDAKVQAVRARLARLLAADGVLTPRAVVKDAKNPKSPLHSEFEWDDSAAAERYRLAQARDLIARVHVHVETRTRHVRVPEYVRNPDADAREQGYVPVATLKTDRAKALDVLRNEAERTAALLQRTRDLAVALDLEGELDPILESFAAFKEHALKLVA